MLRHSTITLLIAAALAWCCGPLHAAGEYVNGNKYGVSPRLAAMVEKAFTKASKRGIDSTSVMEMADSMLILGAMIGDTKAQCLSFDVRINWWISNYDDSIAQIDAIVRQQRRFAERTPLKQYIFSCWGKSIRNKIAKKRPDVLYELREFQQEAFRYDVAWGIARSYRFYGELFDAMDMHENALLALQAGVDYIKRKGNPADLYVYYASMAGSYYNAKQYDKSIEMADLVLQSPYATSGYLFTMQYFKTLCYAEKKDFASMKKSIDAMKEVLPRTNNNDYYVSEYYAGVARYQIFHDNDCAAAAETAKKMKNQDIHDEIMKLIYQRTKDHRRLSQIQYVATKKLLDSQSATYRMSQIVAIDSMLRQSRANEERQAIELANALLMEDEQRQRAKQASLALEAERGKSLIEQTEYTARQRAFDNQMLENSRHSNLLAAKQHEAEARNAQLEAQLLERDSRAIVGMGLIAAIAITIVAMAIYVYFRRSRTRLLEQEEREAAASLDHKNQLIGNLQTDTLRHIGDIRQITDRLAASISARKPIDPADVQAIHESTRQITDLIDKVIDTSEPSTPVGAAATA